MGLFPLSALGLPCLRSGSGGQGRQCLAGPSVLRDGCLVPVQDSSIPLLRYPVCLPRAPALRQVLVAVLVEGALESPSVLVLTRLSSLWEGRPMGQHLVIVSSPLGGCVSFTLFWLSSVASALSLSESWLFFLLWICRCYCRIQWRRPWSWEPPSQSSPFSRSVAFWRLCGASYSPPPLVSSLTAARLGLWPYGLAIAALPLVYRPWTGLCWSHLLSLSSVGVCSWFYCASWLAQGCIPLLCPFALLLAF